MQVKEMLAGSFGGIDNCPIQSYVINEKPFDTVKVRLQTTNNYSGMIDCIKKTLNADGFSGFYKGTLTPLIGVGACVSIQFGALNYMKQLFANENRKMNIDTLSISGPVEQVRTRLQIQGKDGQYKSPSDYLQKVYRQFGLQGIFKGQSITLIREFHGFGVYFATYEYLMQRSIKMNSKPNAKRSDVTFIEQVTYGALAGNLLWLCIYPIDAVKSKIQTDSFQRDKQLFKGILDCVKKTHQLDGVSGFYRGFWPCILRASPVNAATFVAYESALKFLNRNI